MMKSSESLADWSRRNEALSARLLAAARNVDVAATNRHPAANIWSPAQVLEHLVIVNRTYLPLIQEGLKRAVSDGTDSTTRFSFFGKMLTKAAGPDGNAPSPKAWLPRPQPVWSDTLAEWERQQKQMLLLLGQAAGLNLSGASVRNPLVRFIPMNLADCMEIVTAHTERHVGQIEQRLGQRGVALSV